MYGITLSEILNFTKKYNILAAFEKLSPFALSPIDSMLSAIALR
jgi:hypothetical protein